MNVASKLFLADIAKSKALLPFHGSFDGIDSNQKPIVDLFPKWNVKDANNCWCSAFVYYCLIEAGLLVFKDSLAGDNKGVILCHGLIIGG